MIRNAFLALVAIAALALVPSLPAPAQNASQSNVDTKDCSGTITATNTWQQVLKTSSTRGKLLLQNVGTHNMAFALLPMSNNNVTPTATATPGSSGGYVLLPNGSYEPDGGWIDGGELWIAGTQTDPFTCSSSASPGP